MHIYLKNGICNRVQHKDQQQKKGEKRNMDLAVLVYKCIHVKACPRTLHNSGAQACPSPPPAHPPHMCCG
ncbi:hypothetical protein JZ751_019122, partial [Albula glossodonta]